VAVLATHTHTHRAKGDAMTGNKYAEISGPGLRVQLLHDARGWAYRARWAYPMGYTTSDCWFATADDAIMAAFGMDDGDRA